MHNHITRHHVQRPTPFQKILMVLENRFPVAGPRPFQDYTPEDYSPFPSNVVRGIVPPNPDIICQIVSIRLPQSEYNESCSFNLSALDTRSVEGIGGVGLMWTIQFEETGRRQSGEIHLLRAVQGGQVFPAVVWKAWLVLMEVREPHFELAERLLIPERPQPQIRAQD
jgi:hypothetical protein